MEILLPIRHPIPACRTIARQLDVTLQLGGPPTGVAIEDFEQMTLPEAMVALFPEIKPMAGDVTVN